MELIESVTVEKFRCFDKLEVQGLSRVNLFVGANNTGKTALLEALETVVSGDSPVLLHRASFERGEFFPPSESMPPTVGGLLSVRRWFHGHGLVPGSYFRIAAVQRGGGRAMTRVLKPHVDGTPGGFRLATDWQPPGAGKKSEYPISLDGMLGAPPPRVFLRYGLRLAPPVCFVSTDRPVDEDLAGYWEKVQLTPAEAAAETAMRIVDPRVERIAFSGSAETSRALVRLKGATEPVPLGSMGEGSSRLLRLALASANARGGYLLVDELENGIHWGVMPRIWRFLVEAARELDLQVFATTHSKDCLEAIATLHRTSPELAADVSVHRLDAGRSQTVRMAAAEVETLLDTSLEIR